jgi:hypothetical protein
MDKENVSYKYNGILFNLKNEGNSPFLEDKCWGYYTK